MIAACFRRTDFCPRIMNVRSLVSKARPRPRTFTTEVLGAHIRFLKRELKLFSDTIWEQIMLSLSGCCVYSASSQGFAPYQRLKRSRSSVSSITNGESSGETSPPVVLMQAPSVAEFAFDGQSAIGDSTLGDSEDTVVLKVSILGDPETGKTSFMTKYVSGERSEAYVETIGVASVAKVYRVQNASIAFSIWDLGGHRQSASMLPLVCRDASAILIMFDLTRRSTLHSVKDWFLQARECNKTAIPIIIGTKYDCFIDFPRDIRLAIIRQARLYAHAMGAALFFSSVTHNINVHKIFKVIVAKLFDLPCNISKNLNFGEPIIDY